MRIKLFPKFLIFITLLSIVPLVIIGILTIDVNQRMLQTEVLEHYTKITTSLAEKIDEKIASIDRRMGFVIATQTQEGAGGLSDYDQIRILRSLLSASDDFIRASIIESSGNEIVASNPQFEKTPPNPQNYLKNKFFCEVKKTKKYQITPLYYEKKSGMDVEHPAIDFYFPFLDNYILKICVSFESISEIVNETRKGKTGYIYIVDKDGKIIFHKDKNRAISFEDVSGEPIVKESLARAGIGSREFCSKNGIEIIGAFAPVKKLGWSVIFQQTKAEAYSTLLKMRRNAIITIGLVLLLAISVAYLLASSLSKPILKVIDISKNVARRDFTKKIKIKTRDEMADLANNFNQMIDELAHYTKMQADELSAIVYSINDGLVLTDEHNKIVLMNNVAAKIFDIARDSADLLFNVIKNDELLSALKYVSERPGVVREVDLTKDRPFFVSISTQIINDPDKNTVVGIIFVLRDVTGEKEIEKMKEDFFHGITHDLRNPLTSMLGFLKFLIDGSVGELNDKQKYFLEIINKSSHRLLGMINDILDVAKLEVGKMELSLINFDIKNTAERVCSGMMSKAIESRIELINEAPSITLSADEGLIERVLVNLVGNALKYTPSEGRVSITAKEISETGVEWGELGMGKEGAVEVAVVDTGEGIPQEYVDKIFDKFQQVTGRSKGGTGIGLTITKYIVEAHLGKIRVESRLGEGSKFIFTIPKNLKKNKSGEICV
ncbi:MAG: ATP-binding protein [Elusimicrobiota bacterium]